MKKFILASAALVTALGGVAPAFADPPRNVAQRHDDRNDRRDDRRDDRYDHRDDRRDDRYDHRDDRRDDRRDWRDDHRDDRRGPTVVVQRRNYYYVDGHRYDRMRGPVWYAPRDYYYRDWRYGDYVPRGYRTVTIVDYHRYHLPPPRRGERWIRVDGDALLIGAATGLVVAAVSGAFY